MSQGFRGLQAVRFDQLAPELIPAPLCVCEAPGGHLRVYNRRAVRLWGREPDTLSRYCGSLRILDRKGAEIPRDQWPAARVIATGHAVTEAPVVVERPDGSRVDVCVSAEPMYDERGRVIGAVSVLQQVGDAFGVEDSVRHNEARLQTALDVADVGTYDWDITTNRVRRSASASRMLGLTGADEDATHDAFLAVVHPADRAEVMAATKRAFVTGSLDLEYRIIAPDSRVRWLADRGKVFVSPEGRPLRMVGARMDITARREMELALRLSEHRLQLALEAARLGSWQLDLNTWDLTSSAQCKANHGLPPTADFQYADVVAAIADPVRRQHFDDTIQAAIATRSSFEIEVPQQWPDGSAHWLLIGGRVVDAACMVGVTLDITERKNTEQRIEDLNRRKDLFIATLAHELRQPIAPMVTAAALMRSRPGVEPGERARRVIERQVEQLWHLVDDLIDSARIAQGKVQLQLQPLLLGDILADAINVATPRIHERRHRFEYIPVDTSVPLVGDRVRLQQVFSNLLDNAAKYTDPGGCITLTSALVAGSVCVTVRDSGRGIAPETLATIFDIFMQADSTTGLGLGLPVVKRLVELHGGTVTGESAGLGRGSSFTIRLPVTTAHV